MAFLGGYEAKPLQTNAGRWRQLNKRMCSPAHNHVIGESIISFMIFGIYDKFYNFFIPVKNSTNVFVIFIFF